MIGYGPLCPHRSSRRSHHVTARGNRREPIFFEDGDHDVYRNLLAEQCARGRVEVRAYCLMPNHVHLIVVPRDDTGFARATGGRCSNAVDAATHGQFGN
jgi:REP element-mobilizing transposase RayT